jgi:hypothetical protein
MWFLKKTHLDKFFIRMNISVLKKNILLKNYFHLKNDKNYVGGLYIKIYFTCLSKMLDEIKKRTAPKNIPKKIHFFLLEMVLIMCFHLSSLLPSLVCVLFGMLIHCWRGVWTQGSKRQMGWYGQTRSLCPPLCPICFKIVDKKCSSFG